jgi:hypothetical protein
VSPSRVKGRRLTLVLLTLTVGVLVLSAPEALRRNLERGEVYVFSWRFLADIPARLAGPGRFRFILQPTLAALLGGRDGVADARAGRPPYFLALFSGTGGRRQLLRSALSSIANLLLMGILLDAVFQWVIFGASHPGAAVLVGPVLIAAPYSLARALANRAARGLRRD